MTHYISTCYMYIGETYACVKNEKIGKPFVLEKTDNLYITGRYVHSNRIYRFSRNSRFVKGEKQISEKDIQSRYFIDFDNNLLTFIGTNPINDLKVYFNLSDKEYVELFDSELIPIDVKTGCFVIIDGVLVKFPTDYFDGYEIDDIVFHNHNTDKFTSAWVTELVEFINPEKVDLSIEDFKNITDYVDNEKHDVYSVFVSKI